MINELVQENLNNLEYIISYPDVFCVDISKFRWANTDVEICGSAALHKLFHASLETDNFPDVICTKLLSKIAI